MSYRNINAIQKYQQHDVAINQHFVSNRMNWNHNLNGPDVICKQEPSDEFCTCLTSKTLKLLSTRLLLPVPMQTTQGPRELEPLLNFMVPPNDTHLPNHTC